MVSSLRVEDMLDGNSNFRSWKTRIIFILYENEIQYYINKYVVELEDAKEKAKYNKNEEKAKMILIVNCRLIPHIVN